MRAGASDDLARGRSTFMIEMLETSELLRSASSKSLIILDELGRGTSTHDGASIAHATLEYIASTIKALTVFVTHFPMVGGLAKKFSSVGCFHMSCLETTREDGFSEVVFLYKLAAGLSSKSQGCVLRDFAFRSSGSFQKSLD